MIKETIVVWVPYLSCVWVEGLRLTYMAAAPRKKETLRAFDKFLEDGSYERNLVSMSLQVGLEELTDPLFLVGEAIWCVLKKALQGKRLLLI